MGRHALLVELLDGGVDGAGEVGCVLEGAVGQVVPLEVAPGALDVVQFRGIPWQPLHRDPGPLGQRRPAGLAGVYGAVVQHEHHGRAVAAGLRAVSPVQAAKQADEVGAHLDGRGADDQFARGRVERARDGHLARLARRLHPQLGAALGPGMGEVGVRQRLALVGIQQNHVARGSLRLAQRQAHAHAVHRVTVLPPGQRVPGPAPTEPPFLSSALSSTLAISGRVASGFGEAVEERAGDCRHVPGGRRR
jgi:hypothetical protein